MEMDQVMKLDHTMSVSSEIREMAMKIEDYFLRQGIHKWALMNVCSRNHINDVELLKEKIYNIKREVDRSI